MTDFVHLHCHTEYSLLDGAIRIKDLCAKAKEFGMPAAAITDHGNLFGALQFYLACKDKGLKPVIGCEVYVAATNMDDRESEQAKIRYHLVLLAQNETGYRNLLHLVSMGFLKGFYHRPRIDKELLAQHSEGLIALSACLAGEVPRKLMREGMEAGKAAAMEYAAMFPDRFYLEVQANGIPDQVELNRRLKKLAQETGLPLVATNDCHYLSGEDVEAHDTLLCIQTASCVDDANRMRFDTRELYYRSPEEMAAEFADVPEALANTVRIAEQCDIELDLKSHHFPRYELPEGKSLEDEFRDLARKGLTERLEKHPKREELDEKVYWERLETELDIIVQMGFPGYFLIVQDFINWAKDRGIPVGPGRGSAAGSLVAWALRITNLDPLPYKLLFERFLNPERVSMPDIDVDFCERRRTEVIRYVTERYGLDSVAQITTFGKMKAKAVIRDVGRALGLSFGETDRIAKLIPNDLKMTIDKALEQEPELLEMTRADNRVAKLIDISRRLEGLCRHASTHAAGVVISDRPLSYYLPLYKGKKGETVTQFDMKMVEKVGLIKFDFLGLRTMTVVQDTLDLIAGQGEPAPDLDNLSLDDPEVYKLYSRGDTDGIFQVESSGMRRYLRMLKPTCFDDLIAMLALYRPGPLNSGMVDEFIMRKHGEVKVTYPLPELEDALKDTYGVIVYQEQVMKIAQIVAEYSLGEADLLRRAMGKKNAEAMAKESERFNTGAVKRGVDKRKAAEIFNLMAQFAEYGFNKSHSAAYALISYYTAYLKTYHPVEFMAAVLTSEINNQDKLIKYITACRDQDIKVLPPDVNLSFEEFTVKDGQIVYGLGGIKNVGHEAIQEIIAQRETDGPYVSLLDLMIRVNLRKVTKRVLEHLIKSGSMDSLGSNRMALFSAIESASAHAQRRAREKDSGQVSLFSVVETEAPPKRPGVGFECEEEGFDEWPEDVKLRFEKESLGLFLSSHPLLRFRSMLARQGVASLEECRDMAAKSEIRTAVLVTARKEHMTKKGKMCFLTVEDLSGSMEVIVFSNVYAEAKALLDEDQPLLLKARVEVVEDTKNPSSQGSQANQSNLADDEEEQREVKLLAEEILRLSDALAANSQAMVLELPAKRLENGGVLELKALLRRHQGPAKVQLLVRYEQACCRLELGPQFCVTPTLELEEEFAGWAGQELSA